MQKKISPAQLRVGMYLDKLGASWLDHPFWRRSFLIEDPASIAQIVELGITEIWIDTGRGLDVEVKAPAASLPAANSPVDPATRVLANKPARVVEEDLVSAMARAQRLCESARGEVASMFGDVRMGRAINVESVGPLVEEIASSVRENAAALISVARLKTHDDYTYLHSVAVCALMVALARELGLDEAEVRRAGVGGLMHDLGKALMPINILNKPGKLTDEEYAVMKLHPAVGHRLLAEGGGADEATLEIALHHHEKMDGSGYPGAQAGEGITHWSRMGAVCDVYDAITSNRPYKSGWDPAQAIRRMNSWKGHFDERILRAFVKSVGIYPVGALVRLRSDRLGVVVEPGRSSLIKPKVKVFFSARSREPITTEIVDLEAARSPDAIAGPEDPATWGFTHLVQLWTPQ